MIFAPLFVSLCLAAPGIKSTSPLEDLKTLDARLPEFLKAGPALTSVLATTQEIKQVLTAMKINKADLELVLASSIEQQTPKADAPTSFAPTSAIVTKPDAATKTFEVHFYDGKTRLDVSLLKRANKTLVLMDAPSHASQNELEGDLLLRRSSKDAAERDVSYFVKENGAWKSAPLPAVTQEQCLERLRAPALAIAESQARYFKANKTYTKSFGALDFDGTKFLVVASLKSGDATKFLATVRMFGGEVTIDQSNKPVDATPCSLVP